MYGRTGDTQRLPWWYWSVLHQSLQGGVSHVLKGIVRLHNTTIHTTMTQCMEGLVTHNGCHGGLCWQQEATKLPVNLLNSRRLPLCIAVTTSADAVIGDDASLICKSQTVLLQQRSART